LSIFNRKNIVKDILLVRELNLASRQKIFLGLLAACFAMSLNWFSYLYVLQHISLKSAALAYLIAPLFTAILAVIFYKDRLYKLQKVALALAFLSVSILSFSYFSEVLWSMFVAFFYAVYMIFQKWTSALNKLNVLFCHISIVLLSLFLLFDISIIYIPQEISFWKNIGSIVFIFTLLPLYLNLYANQYIPSSTLGILIYINPLVAFLLSIFLF